MAARAVGAELLRRWNEPHRHYHTERHLESMLDVVDANEADPAVSLAVWYHDAVYDPRAADNEKASAALAERQLPALGVDPAEVVRLVLLTTTHDPQPGDRNGLLMADADLSILAAEPARYDEYAKAVRREYSHVPDGHYCAGRAEVMGRFLLRPTLYRIVPDKAAWTTRAHRNIRRELASLGRSG